MKTLSRERLGTMLVHAGKIDNDQLEKSLQIQKKKGGVSWAGVFNQWLH